MPEEVHTVVQPEGERTQRDVSSLPIQKSSGAHYETETRVKLMFASDEYSHFYTLILKKKVCSWICPFQGRSGSPDIFLDKILETTQIIKYIFD